jgi:uncharacterized protein involved in cysteine biosynthesis
MSCFSKADLEMVLVILFLGVGLILSIFFAMENLASAIIGAFAGYLARTIKDNMKGKGDMQ